MLILFSVVLFIVLLNDSIALEPNFLNVDYQIHSYNDLKELPQVLLKGARRFKFDPHYVLFSSQCGDQKSCFLLNHDKPTTELSQYNTSTELLNYLKSNEFHLLTQGERVTIALCFKSAPDLCQNTTEFQNWLRLVDEFYFHAQDVPKHIEFILDGDAKPINCLIGYWKQWNSVWINTGSPQDAFYSNSIDNDYYRFQVLNNPEDFANWTWMASSEINYGKFSKGNYPYQLWEPDSQQDIRDYISLYHSGATHSPAGFHFAINIDIAMFRIYSSRSNSTSIGSTAVVEQATTTLPGEFNTTLSFSQPLVVSTVLENNTTVSLQDTLQDMNPLLVQVASDTILSVTSQYSDEFSTSIVLSLLRVNRLVYTVHTETSVSLSTVDAAWLLAEEGVTLVSAILLPSESEQMPIILVMNSAGRFVVLQLHVYIPGEVAILSTIQGTLPSEQLGAVYYDIVVRVQEEGNSTYSSCCSEQDQQVCLLVLTQELTESATAAPLKLSTLVLTTTTAAIKMLGTTKVAAPSTDGQVSSARLAQLNEGSDTGVTVVFCAQNLVIYATEVISYTASGSSSSAQQGWSAVTTGKNFQVSIAGKGLDQALMLVSDYGYCYNSHTHNTRSYPTVCSSLPQPTETVLDYSLALSKHWLEALRDPAYYYSERVNSSQDTTTSATTTVYISTSCSEKILHGSYDQGSHPAVVLSYSNFSHLSIGEKTYFFLSAHEGIPMSIQYTESSRGGGGCGEPVHYDGVVLDAFAVDAWIRALKQTYL